MVDIVIVIVILLSGGGGGGGLEGREKMEGWMDGEMRLEEG